MGLLKWDGATAGARGARVIIVFRTLGSDVLGLSDFEGAELWTI